MTEIFYNTDNRRGVEEAHAEVVVGDDDGRDARGGETGCAAGMGQYGSATRSNAVNRTSQSGLFPARHRYFYSGGKSEPTAILGLCWEYSLRSDFWTEIDPSDHQMGEWRRFLLQSMTWYDDRSDGRECPTMRLIDRQGNMVGLLYSCYGWIVVEFLLDNYILIRPPQLQATDYSVWENLPGASLRCRLTAVVSGSENEAGNQRLVKRHLLRRQSGTLMLQRP